MESCWGYASWRQRSRWVLWGLLAVLAASAYPLRADTLIFPNGDRLSGKKVGEEDGVIIFESTMVGRLRVPAGEVTIELAPPPPPPTPTSPPPPPTAQATPAPAKPAQAPKPAPAKPPAKVEPPPPEPLPSMPTETLALNPSLMGGTPDELPWWHADRVFAVVDRWNPFSEWDSKLEVGLIYQSGQVEKNDLTFRLTSTYQPRKETSYRLTARYDYGTQKRGKNPETVSKDAASGSFRYRRDLNEDYFVQNVLTGSRDTVKGRVADIDDSLGIGYEWLKTERWEATVTPALGVRYLKLEDEDADTNLIISIFQDVDYRLNSRTRVQQESRFQYALNDGEITFGFSANVENKVTDRLNFNLRYEYDYTTELRANIQEEEHRISFAVGTRF